MNHDWKTHTTWRIIPQTVAEEFAVALATNTRALEHNALFHLEVFIFYQNKMNLQTNFYILNAQKI